MKEQTKIPTTKVQRASKFIGTGAKVGANYLKYYAKKAVTGKADKEALDDTNAEDIYNSLSTLKGSALKAAQMLSMDQNLLPRAYADKFQRAQYSAPPLSYPLVVKTFRRFFNKRPDELFETFSKSAKHAASIGQVHKASIGGKTFAVKVQYPGVADSVKSDLRIAMPLAARIMNVKQKDIAHYMQEVESKLLEETDYILELERSMKLTEACRHLDQIIFPQYYPEYSSKRILTMDWIAGKHLREWKKTNPPQELINRIGQALWDFYDFQVHTLKTVHADPHPGNFLITEDGQLAIIDFGCVKVIPVEFYKPYFSLLSTGVLPDDKLMDIFRDLNMILPGDSASEIRLLFDVMKEMTLTLGEPFQTETFDFSDPNYFKRIYELSESLQHNKEFRKMNQARGSKDAIYVNRTYFGLYSVLHELGAEINTQKMAVIEL